MKLQVTSVPKDPEIELIEAEARLYELEYDELPKGFWNPSEWNDIVMEKVKLKRTIEKVKEVLSTAGI